MPRFALLATTGIALVLAGCAKPDTANQAAGQQSNQALAPTQAAPASPGDRLLAAAEPFEALTETAFADPPAKLDETIAKGRKAAADIRSLLTPAAATKIDGLLADIGRYRGAGQRANLALSSIEVYRALMDSVPPGSRVPVDVSLLDYAGFRYQADLKSSPVRWDDMKQAASYARTRWAQLAPKIADKAVSGPFETALQDMEKAVASRDSKLAQSAVTAELDQVDKLEAYFNVR